MSSWADRAKIHFANVRQKLTPKTTESPLLGVMGVPSGQIQEKTHSKLCAANDAAPDPDRWCWPASDAMSTVELETFMARLARFSTKGMNIADCEVLADKLVIRDREKDDRHSCFECTHLAGSGSWRCGNGQSAGVAIRARDAQLPTDLVNLLQRCDGFKESYRQKTTSFASPETPERPTP